MKGFSPLLKLQLRASLGLSALKYAFKNDRKSAAKSIGIGLAVFLAFAEIFGMYCLFLFMMFQSGKQMNVPEIIITVACVGSGLVVLFFGIFSILSNLFFAKDSEFLSTLPLRQETVFAAKFTQVIFYEYPFVLLMMLPAVIIYGAGTGAGVLYYLISLICIILLPAVPLAIAAFVSLILMKLVSHIKRRDMLVTVLSIAILALIILFTNVLMAKLPSSGGKQLEMMIFSNTKTIIDMTGRVYLPAVWITKALTAGGVEAILNFAFYLVCTAAFLGLVYFMAVFIYQSGAQAQFETAKKQSKRTLGFKGSSPVIAVCKTEWRRIYRTPIYAMNSLAGIVIGPLLMSMPLFSGNVNDPDLKKLFTLLYSKEAAPFVMLITAGILIFMAVTNIGLPTTISREGKSIWFLKSIPVTNRDIIIGKLLCGYIICIAIILPTTVVMAFAFRFTFLMTLPALLLTLVLTVSTSALSIVIDLLRPKLSWNNETEAIKQNLNAVLGMLIGFLFIGLFALISVPLLLMKMPFILIFMIDFVIAAVLGVLSVILLCKTAERQLERMEI